MEDIKFTQIQECLFETNYLKNHLNRLLSIAQTAQFCPNLLIKLIIHGPDGSGKRLLCRSASKHLGMHFHEENVCDLFDENIVGTEKKVRAALARLTTTKPCIVYLSGYQLFCELDDIDIDRIESFISKTLDELETTQPILFIASTNDHQRIFKSPLSRIFHYDLPLDPANIEEAQEIINHITSRLGLAESTPNLTELRPEFELYIGNLMDHIAKHNPIDYDHLDPIIKTTETFKKMSDSAKSRSNICWQDIGGLGNIKQEIINAFKMSLDFPELKATGLKRTGILLYGPPGTGKTLLAKAVATECNLKFMSVKGPELLNEYVGQSEDNVRKVFEKARQSSPAIIFFDEIDSLVPNRGQAGESGGVMDRIVSQVCAEMDGIGKTGEVFVMGATNRVDLVDPSLLRPGRFDKILEVPLPNTKTDRLQILNALTRKMNLGKEVNLEILEAKMPSNMSGADIRRFCSLALEKAFDRAISQVESGQSSEEEVVIEIKMEDFGL